MSLDAFICPICRRPYPADVRSLFCRACGDPLLSAFVPKSPAIRRGRPMGVARYLGFLPLPEFDPDLSLGEGGTPLFPLNRLRSAFRTPPLWVKNEAVNPTGSFKDRGSIVAIHMAKALGFETVGTISTGNMAGSTAAYAAKAGLRTVVFVKDDTPLEKILSAGMHGANVIRVRGNYARLFVKSFEIGRVLSFYFINSVDPYRIEGYKVTSFEIYEQMGGKAPDYLFVPVSSGGHLIGLLRGFLDLKRAGRIRRLPRIVGVQARGCAPIARTFARGRAAIVPVRKPQTIAHAIANPQPPAGRVVLKLLAAHGGAMEAVGETEILRAQRLLAEDEGLLSDPASATVLAAFLRMSKEGRIPADAASVLVLTGSGLKTLGDVDQSRLRIAEADLSDLPQLMAAWK
ncbi:MAG: threonine synthase [Acidobacteriota bacterium]|nr:threonine synthase [Acidobacteriota bacterium]MDD8033047.1 threonine synthase [Acidobacteriota bacterium]MDD8039465.1 threonine synthase [Acidobacteriota bacterium]